jgi:hypothetical protein
MLRPLVEEARKALKQEDDFLRQHIIGNPLYPGELAGVLRTGFMDERYYQRLVAKQLLNGQHHVDLEKVYHDLVLFDLPQTYFAVIEMKLWMDAAGDLSGIIVDIDKLRKSILNPQHKVMLIFSANPDTETTTSISYLSAELAKPPVQIVLRSGQSFELEKFQTNSDWPRVQNTIMDFWVAGIEVS